MLYVLPFIIAMAVTMAGLPMLARWATRWNFVDLPGARKVHTAPIPRIGGLAMALGVLVAALIAVDLEAQDRWFLVAAGVLVTFGALDDRFDLNYRIKFIGQLLAVVIVVVFGDVQIHAITLDDRVMLPGAVSVALTIIFLVGITNAVNLADGLDGLAGGTTFLSLCAVALLCSVGGQTTSTALCLAFAGAVLGFLRFNTYPASVFMGDAGSQLLGFTIGVLSIRATQSLASQVSSAIPILLLAIPILDTLSVMVQRISERRSPFSPDKNHIHHKLLALGLGHHEAVMVIYAMQGTLFIAAYLLRYESDLLILAVVTVFFALSITLLQMAARSGGQSASTAVAPAPSAPLSRMVAAAQRPSLLPRLSYLAIVLSLGTYAALIVSGTVALSLDIRGLLVTLLALTAALFVFFRAGPLSVAEKATLYVTATVLVYLDAVVLAPDPLMSILTWTSISIAALATAMRLRLQNDRRFQVTPLDLIVLFMALVVPSLPGTFSLPPGGAWSIAKLLVLFYAVEVLVSRSEGRAIWLRVAMASILTALVVRPLLPF
jgi:UDP-GlcNAc:undecaprenyl-phosphate/decaprenyl-phosphate GlcNAc-1-phosphate transferase